MFVEKYRKALTKIDNETIDYDDLTFGPDKLGDAFKKVYKALDNYEDLVDFIFDMHPENEAAKGIINALQNFIKEKEGENK